MSSERKSLPNDIDALKALVAEQRRSNQQLQADKDALSDKNAQLQNQVLTLQEQLNLALARRYRVITESGV